ncbi:AAA family ATPase [bacterium]|nr:AAA family ATPase [bacterium]
MYLDFYGLAESPFNLTPDTSFLFPSRVHREVLAHLFYGVNSRKGFIVVSGEVGSGKTTLCRALLTKLGPDTEAALVLNSFLSELELLKTINEDFGIKSKASSRKELIDELNDFLLDRRMKGKNVVLIIDEAQNLSFPVLEQIRMLSNLETEKEKLLQIVLMGQPELRRLLASPRLRQLNQRITVRHHITPLTKKETVQYVYHRLKIAGSSGNIVFTEAALNEIYRFSGGIPRVINVLCDQALLSGYVANSMKVDRKIVQAGETEIEGAAKQHTGFFAREFSLLRVGATVGLVLATFLIAVTALRPIIEKALLPGTTSRSGKKLGALSVLARETGESHAKGVVAKAQRGKEGKQAAQLRKPGIPTSGSREETDVGFRVSDFGGRNPRSPIPHPSLMRMAFLARATTRVGQTLPSILGPDMEPLFREEKVRLTTPSAGLPPRPKVKLDPISDFGFPISDLGGRNPEAPIPDPRSPIRNGSKAPSLARELDDRVVAYRSFVEPLFSVLRLWKRSPATIQAVRERYSEVGGHLPSLAVGAKMGWLNLRSDLRTLRMIDMPAIVEIIGDADEQRGYVTVVAMGETWVEVATASGTKRLDIQLFSKIFAGNATVLCNDVFVNPEPLREGQGISLSVRKLQDYMKAAGYFDGNPSGWFTPATTAAVRAFQKDHGLPTSGEADGRTKLLLYASQGLAEVPHLCALE